MPLSELCVEDRRVLLGLARGSIERGLCGQELHVVIEEYSAVLRTARASFVTIEVDARLRGCIGSLEPRRPLVMDVVQNAHSSAFGDPRFPALTFPEFERLDIHISILSAPEPVHFASEEDLIGQLRPRVDGLILEEGFRRGTFLPVVWESLPEPREFLRQLKRKAGLPADFWSGDIRVSRYTTESIP